MPATSVPATCLQRLQQRCRPTIGDRAMPAASAAMAALPTPTRKRSLSGANQVYIRCKSGVNQV
jgi:hypothetical protein